MPALSFSAPFLSNIALYYAGFAFVKNPYKSFLFAALQVLYLFVSLYFANKLWQERGAQKKNWLKCVGMGWVFVFCFAFSAVQFGYSWILFRTAAIFAIMGIPSIIAGAICGMNNKSDMFSLLERLCFFILPAVFSYIVMIIFDISPFTSTHSLGSVSLGRISYLGVAYGLLPFLFSCIICYLDERPGFGNIRTLENNRVIRPFMVLLLLAAITLSGGRGPFFCFVLFVVLCAFYYVLKIKRKISIPEGIVMGAVILIMLLPFQTILFDKNGILPGKAMYAVRMTFFLKHLDKGELITTDEDPAIINAFNIKKLVEAPVDYHDEEINLIKAKALSRSTLFKLAIGEFLKNPVTGMGPLGFTIKYGNYPHNIMLEALADLGVIFGGVFIFAVIGSFLKFFYYSLKDKNVAYMMLFLSGYFIMFMASGSMWSSSVLLFIVAYSMSYKANM